MSARTDPPATGREIALAAVVLAAVTAAVFGAHVVHGGLYSDDWSNAASTRFADAPRYVHAVADQARALGSRPLLAALLPLPFAVFGASAAPLLVVALALGALTALLFYVFLRSLGLGPLDAGAPALLALLFPWADSIRLWGTASVNTVALCFGLAGLAVASRSVRGAAHPLRLQVMAVVLFVLSVLTYEVMGIVLLCTGALYLGVLERRQALRRWGIDAAAVGAALVYTALTTSKQPASVGAGIRALPVFARQSVALLSRSFVPPGTQASLPRALALLVAGAVVALLLVRVRRGGGGGEAERRAQLLLATGMVGTACAYAVFLQSTLRPLATGLDNRVNLFAALGLSLLVWGLVRGAAALLARGDERRGTLVAAGLAVLVLAGYVVQDVRDERAWDGSARIQAALLRTLAPATAAAPPGSTLVAFGVPETVRGGPPVFDATWDLDGALQLRTHRRIVHAYPVSERTVLRCGPAALELAVTSGDPVQLPYGQGRLVFANARTGASTVIRGRKACRAARMPRGPVEVAPTWR